MSKQTELSLHYGLSNRYHIQFFHYYCVSYSVSSSHPLYSPENSTALTLLLFLSLSFHDSLPILQLLGITVPKSCVLISLGIYFLPKKVDLNILKNLPTFPALSDISSFTLPLYSISVLRNLQLLTCPNNYRLIFILFYLISFALSQFCSCLYLFPLIIFSILTQRESSPTPSGYSSATHPFPVEKDGVFLNFHQFLAVQVIVQHIFAVILLQGNARTKGPVKSFFIEDEPSRLRVKQGTEGMNSQHRQNVCVSQLLLPAYRSKLTITALFDVIPNSRSQTIRKKR